MIALCHELSFKSCAVVKTPVPIVVYIPQDFSCHLQASPPCAAAFCTHDFYLTIMEWLVYADLIYNSMARLLEVLFMCHTTGILHTILGQSFQNEVNVCVCCFVTLGLKVFKVTWEITEPSYCVSKLGEIK
jgi:hypothetical protein